MTSLRSLAYVHWLMDRDRKSTGLKSLQGKIWEEGYRAGDLQGEVYPDVLPALERWRVRESTSPFFPRAVSRPSDPCSRTRPPAI